MSWRDRALCRDKIEEDPQLMTAWDNIEYGDTYLPDPLEDLAKEICAECPVRNLCLESAVVEPASEGIRGGYRFHMGTVTQSDAHKIKINEKLKARTKRGSTLHHVSHYGL